MPLPRPQPMSAPFLNRLAKARERVLLLDFDGTLAPFAADPRTVSPYCGVAQLLDEIMEQPRSRVVIVTGRDLVEQPPPLLLRQAPEMWGAHGWQWRAPGGRPIPLQVPPPAIARLALAAERAQTLARIGARIERKPASVAVHWRGLDAAAEQAVRKALLPAWRGMTRGALERVDFEAGAELRVRGRNKGSVVREVLAKTPGAAAAYLGDDLPDEDAFAAIRGHGCGALVRPSWRRSHATLWLRPPSDLIRFLERWRDCTMALAR
jgi:trehalose 6-phosphate phosphatase